MFGLQLLKSVSILGYLFITMLSKKSQLSRYGESIEIRKNETYPMHRRNRQATFISPQLTSTNQRTILATNNFITHCGR